MNRDAKCIHCGKVWIHCPRCYGAGALAMFDAMVLHAPEGFDQMRFVAALALRLHGRAMSESIMDDLKCSDKGKEK